VLTFQPHLLAKSISSLSTLKSWDPVPTAEYLSVVRYLAQLLQSAAIDHRVRSQLRAAFAAGGGQQPAVGGDAAMDDAAEEPVLAAASGTTDASLTSQSQQNVLSGLLNSWLPPGNKCCPPSSKLPTLCLTPLCGVHVLIPQGSQRKISARCCPTRSCRCSAPACSWLLLWYNGFSGHCERQV
jgi:hypothetical protein